MARLGQRNTERAGLEFRVYAGFLSRVERFKKDPPKGGTPNGNDPLANLLKLA